MSFQIIYRDESIQEELNARFLRLGIDKHINSKSHIELMLPTLNSACCVIGCLKHYSTLKTLKMAHQAYFHSAMVNGIMFCGNSINNNKVFLQQKWIVRSILGIEPWSTCKPHFKTLGIMTMPSHYIPHVSEWLERFQYNQLANHSNHFDTCGIILNGTSV